CGIIHAVISLVCVSTSHYSEDHSGEVTFFFVPPVRELCSARGCPASPEKIGEPPVRFVADHLEGFVVKYTDI
ncbi:MAG: hypothetical protein J6N18_07475, partial [Kiritimatiellae bacterium]|nr:hypothetical protein [Kiritimatiellia bacterium]